jgi:hypothetical protein
MHLTGMKDQLKDPLGIRNAWSNLFLPKTKTKFFLKMSYPKLTKDNLNGRLARDTLGLGNNLSEDKTFIRSLSFAS